MLFILISFIIDMLMLIYLMTFVNIAFGCIAIFHIIAFYEVFMCIYEIEMRKIIKNKE